jgi:hypothetical protein
MDKGIVTIGELLRFLHPGFAESREVPTWPPDVFGLSASLLLESEAFLRVFDDWPPESGLPPETWAERMRQAGAEWREGFSAGTLGSVADWWRTLIAAESLAVREIPGTPAVVEALLCLLAAADEACAGAGSRPGDASEETDPFLLLAADRLAPDPDRGSTLCRAIPSDRLRVLPKRHTPQNGITIRSLSRHLALWNGNRVTPFWHGLALPREASAVGNPRGLNLLLLPWPEEVSPKWFVPAQPPEGGVRNLDPSRFGFFDYRREAVPGDEIRARLDETYRAALRLADRIDAVVFPELAFLDEELDAVRAWSQENRCIAIAGVGGSETGGPDGSPPGRNQVLLQVPGADPESALVGQDKHHRWRLTRSQIVQYGLGGQLDPDRTWWEHIEARKRRLAFVSFEPGLTVCALVCEDLARQDSVAELVRAVGPNLVIALLMDGPQLQSRWPARYATVLSDDPGSSVLTLTSAGICRLSRSPAGDVDRTVALWRDACSDETQEIQLPEGAQGILLNLVRQEREEWTADGRRHRGTAGYPGLAGVHPVFVRQDR